MDHQSKKDSRLVGMSEWDVHKYSDDQIIRLLSFENRTRAAEIAINILNNPNKDSAYSSGMTYVALLFVLEIYGTKLETLHDKCCSGNLLQMEAVLRDFHLRWEKIKTFEEKETLKNNFLNKISAEEVIYINPTMKELVVTKCPNFFELYGEDLLFSS